MVFCHLFCGIIQRNYNKNCCINHFLLLLIDLNKYLKTNLKLVLDSNTYTVYSKIAAKHVIKCYVIYV